MYKYICCVLEGLIQRLAVLKILWLCYTCLQVPTFRSMSLIHLMTRWDVQTSGSTFWCSHCIRRACRACRSCWHHTEILPSSHLKLENILDWCLVLTSLSNWSSWSSSMPSNRLTWWNFLVMLRWRSRSWRVSEFSMRPSTRWLWKAWEYWGRPTSLNQALATQWWSRSAALDNLF